MRHPQAGIINPRLLLPIIPIRPEKAAEIPTAVPFFSWNQLFKRIGAGSMQRKAEAVP